MGDQVSKSAHIGESKAQEQIVRPKPEKVAPKTQSTAVKAEGTNKINAQPTTWSYVGVDGPLNWGALSPSFHLCAAGKMQSPIDIITERLATKANPTRFNGNMVLRKWFLALRVLFHGHQ